MDEFDCVWELRGLVRELERLGFGTDEPINGADVVDLLTERFDTLKAATK